MNPYGWILRSGHFLRFDFVAILLAPLFIAIVFSAPAWAADSLCGKEVDLTGVGGSMEHVQPRNQGRFDICYAEQTVEMMDVWRFAHGDRNFAFQTSGMVLALRAADPDLVGTKGVEGGLMDHHGGNAIFAMKVVKQTGICNIRGGVESLDPGSAFALVKSLYQVENEENRWACKGERTDSAPSSDANLPVIESLIAKIVGEYQIFLPNEGSLKSSLADVNLSVNTRLDQVLTASCARPGMSQSVDVPEISEIGYLPNGALGRISNFFAEPPESAQSQKDFIDYLESHLADKRSLPLAISICSNFLLKGHEKFAVFDPDGKWVRGRECLSHAVLAVGKRFNREKNKCELLIRDSYGPECSGLSPAWQCQNGSEWIDADTLANNLFEIEEFGPPEDK